MLKPAAGTKHSWLKVTTEASIYRPCAGQNLLAIFHFIFYVTILMLRVGDSLVDVLWGISRSEQLAQLLQRLCQMART